jgi:hypothetical protein
MNDKITILNTDHQRDGVIVEFSDGRIGSFDPQFLIDNLETNGNHEVANEDPSPVGI